MYLVYESLYGDLLNECDNTCIIGLYDSREKAIKKMKELIEEDLKNNYVLDDIKCDMFARLFYNNYENWACYYEINIEEIEVQ